MNVVNTICHNNAEEWATRNPLANDGDMDVFKNIHAELNTDLMISYIHLSNETFSCKHFDILLWSKCDEETSMPLLHLEVFHEMASAWNGKPDINIRINVNRQFEGMDMMNAIPKHGYIKSGMARHTESCDLDVSFRLHRKHAYGYIPDGSDMDGDDEDNEDDDDDGQGMDGGGQIVQNEHMPHVCHFQCQCDPFVLALSNHCQFIINSLFCHIKHTHLLSAYHHKNSWMAEPHGAKEP